jgi:hypothetical protein
MTAQPLGGVYRHRLEAEAPPAAGRVPRHQPVHGAAAVAARVLRARRGNRTAAARGHLRVRLGGVATEPDSVQVELRHEGVRIARHALPAVRARVAAGAPRRQRRGVLAQLER